MDLRPYDNRAIRVCTAKGDRFAGRAELFGAERVPEEMRLLGHLESRLDAFAGREGS